jgi:hypothetical protein
MHTKSFVFAALLAALAGAGNSALAQYGHGQPSPYGYPGMPPQGMMGPGMLGPGTMPGMYNPGAMGGGVMPAGYMAAGGGGPGCTDPTCTKAGCEGDCCGGGYCHCWSVFGEFLYMRARDAEVAYAVPIDGNITDPSDPVFQVGEVQVVDPNYQPGFRFGFTRTCSECSLVAVTYSQLDADANDTLVLAGGALGTPVARSLVSPLPINTAVDTLDAEAHLFVQFKTLDVDYKSLIAYCDDYRLAFVVGARFAKLNQEFDAIFETNGFDTVATDVEFEGAGIKMGLEGERFGRNRQWFVYGKGDVALLGGESRATYFGSNNADESIIDTSWKAGRMVTVTDLEAGFGWQNCCGNLRLSAGYSFSTWYNITRTNEWINAVQKNNFADESDNLFGFMSFDGINARIEVLW